MERWRLLTGWAFGWGPELSGDASVRLGDTWLGDGHWAPIAHGGGAYPRGPSGHEAIIIWDDAPGGREFSRVLPEP